MSTKVITWAWDRHDWDQQPLADAHEATVQLAEIRGRKPKPFEMLAPSTLKFVLVAIGDEANSDGTNAWPSVERICRKTELGERTVRRAIRRLEELGYIEVRYREGGDRDLPEYLRPNHYVVQLDRHDPATEGPERPRVPLPERPPIPCRSGPGSGAGDDEPTGRSRQTDLPERPLTQEITQEPTHRAEPAAAGEKRKRHRDQLEVALAAALGWQPSTKPERAAWNVAVTQLFDVEATTDEIRARARKYRELYPTAQITPQALVRHWSSLGAHATPPATFEELSRRHDCARCGGTGYVDEAREIGAPGTVRRCPDCNTSTAVAS